jgi:hypothetical protein
MAVAIDGDEQAIARREVRADRAQTQRLLAWAAPLGAERTWAIESAGGLGKLLSQELVAAGEHEGSLQTRAATSRWGSSQPISRSSSRSGNSNALLQSSGTTVGRRLKRASFTYCPASNGEKTRLLLEQSTEAAPVTRPVARRVLSLIPRYALEHKQDVVLVLAVGHGVIDLPARLSIAPQDL